MVGSAGEEKRPEGTQEVRKSSILVYGDWMKEYVTKWTRRLNIWM
jgi:hypothetical protein